MRPIPTHSAGISVEEASSLFHNAARCRVYVVGEGQFVQPSQTLEDSTDGLRQPLSPHVRHAHQRIARAYLRYGYSMKALAGHLGLHIMTISRAVRAYEDEMLEC